MVAYISQVFHQSCRVSCVSFRHYRRERTIRRANSAKTNAKNPLCLFTSHMHQFSLHGNSPEKKLSSEQSTPLLPRGWLPIIAWSFSFIFASFALYYALLLCLILCLILMFFDFADPVKHDFKMAFRFSKSGLLQRLKISIAACQQMSRSRSCVRSRSYVMSWSTWCRCILLYSTLSI